MFRTILIPLDGSPFGEQALPMALTIARRAGAALEVIHAHVPDDPKHPDWYMPIEQRSDPNAVKAQRDYLEGIVNKVKAADLSATARLIVGPTAEAISEHVAAVKPDLMVMTTHGRGPLSRFWLGSVADALVRRLTIPMILVRPKAEPIDTTVEVPLRHILIPLDGSKHGEAILGPALELGQLMGSGYTLLRVVEPIPVLGYDVFGYATAGTDVALVDRMREEAYTYLDKMANQIRESGRHVRTLVQVNPSAASAILNEAEPVLNDLVALETHGRGGPSRVLLGSVADKVIRAAVTPVLVHRSVER